MNEGTDRCGTFLFYCYLSHVFVHSPGFAGIMCAHAFRILS